MKNDHLYICYHGDEDIFGPHHDNVRTYNSRYNYISNISDDILGEIYRLTRRPIWMGQVIKGIFDEQ